ncbi:hypothetical protein G0Q06_05435 [Puniceicoccales bacterium CK1056]|uniref:Beta-xylanase n=1 Tax=Oceanipulchritudo coccoides TaxID=2706888 RepID=A0A6B2M0K8_9BACT|nr:endo-1,4-beta-xylanase [Oceanipulchritudo coccoides]NDV61886.1 hypothetical protein [Oceanipulchritudo coccoides]
MPIHEAWNLKEAEQRIEQYRKGTCTLTISLPDGSFLPEGTPVGIEQTRHAFNFGGSLAQVRSLHGQGVLEEYKVNFARLFNYSTIGFYWSLHERRRGEWNLQDYTRDAIDWAQSKGMTLRGHPLMWHNAIPKWISDTNRPVSEIDKDIKEHVRRLVRLYPEIHQWDLYNEAPGIRLVDPDWGARRWVESTGGAGPMTALVVKEVRSVKPDGYFILNHFNGNDPEYWDQVEFCLSNDVPFDAIGIQTHMHSRDSVLQEEEMNEMLKRFSVFEKPLHLSEISVLSCEPFESYKEIKAYKESINQARRQGKDLPFINSSPEWEKYQADYTRDFYTLAFSYPKVEAIIWWSVSDRAAWRGAPAGLLDRDCRPKPVYRVLDKLINQQWKTRLRTSTDESGSIGLRGFYGSYRLTVSLGKKSYVGSFEISRDSDNTVNIHLTKLIPES